MAGKKSPSGQTPATQFLQARGVAFTEHPYEYLEHGGAEHSAKVLGLDPFSVVKTLVMQDQDGAPLIVLMHGNRQVSTKNLARQIGATSELQGFTAPASASFLHPTAVLLNRLIAEIERLSTPVRRDRKVGIDHTRPPKPCHRPRPRR
jgi:hypothetical protein